MKKDKITKVMCLALSTVLVFSLAGCGKGNADESVASVITSDNEEEALTEILNGQVSTSHSSEAGKEETVYVLADAKGTVNQVIVSDWLKNSEGENSLADISDLNDIENVKGYETFETDEDGNIIWQAQGSDIYYRGNSDKEVPVEVKISYKLDGKDISPEELAGKSGRVTIRMDYENKETTKVMVGDQEEEIKIPFAMISGMILPQDIFSNIEVTNAKLMSEGENSIVIGLAFPGLKESIDLESLQDKLSEEEDDEIEIPDYIEVTADATNFKLDMTMTVAMSDILSDIELTDSFDLSSMTDSMDELRDATDELKDGTTQLKDGTGELKDGTKELLDGAKELADGSVELKDGTKELYEKSGLLNAGAVQLADGASALYSGTLSLEEGASKLKTGTDQLQGAGQQLLDGTGSLVAGVAQLNDGAGQVSAGVQQVAGQMNTLKGYIGTADGAAQPGGTPTLLQLSALLNQNIKTLSNFSDEQYNYIQMQVLESLKQQKAEAQTNLESSKANLEAAQSKVQAAEAELFAACQENTREVEIVTDTHTETESREVEVEAPVYSTTKVISVDEETKEQIEEESSDVSVQTVTGTVDVEKEVVETDTVQIQSLDTEALRQRAEAYQNALQEVSTYQAEVTAYGMQVAALDDAIAAADVSAQADNTALWTQTVTYGITLQAMLTEISGTLNSETNTQSMAALVKGAGDLAIGTQSALNGAKGLNSGVSELNGAFDSLGKGAGELSNGAGSLKNGAATLKSGTGELKSGTGQLVDGTAELNDGARELRDGIATLKDGVVTLDDGAGTLDEGALELLEGMFEFDEEGISKLTELFGDDVQDVVDRLKAVADAGKDYNTFTSLPEGMDGSVKFIIKTEAVN